MLRLAIELMLLVAKLAKCAKFGKASGRWKDDGPPPPEGRELPSHSEMISIDCPPRRRFKTSSQSSGRTRAARTWSLDRCRWRRLSISPRKFSLDWRTGIS